MKHIISTLVLACVLGLILTGQAQARTWTVEKDGSGDFTVIQDALDAASPGDSVVVGPGRYEDFTPRAVVGGTIHAIAWVTKNNITLLGASRESVTLGPTVMPPNSNSEIWVGVSVDPVTGIVLESITLETLFGGINNEGDLTIRDINSSDNEERGLTNNGAFPLTILDSSLERNGDFGLFLGTDDYNVLVERCRFVDNQEGITARSTQGITIRDCHFEAPGINAAAGINIAWGAYGEVSNCTFGVFPLGGAIAAQGSVQLTVRSCVMDPSPGGSVNMLVYDAAHVEATDNILGGADWATVDIRDRATINFYENHILNLGEYSVRVRDYFLPGTYPIHLENNWWGTMDETQVEQWIYDAPDPAGVFTPIYWQPILGAPVPTEETSFGSLKARFQSP